MTRAIFSRYMGGSSPPGSAEIPRNNNIIGVLRLSRMFEKACFGPRNHFEIPRQNVPYRRRVLDVRSRSLY